MSTVEDQGYERLAWAHAEAMEKARAERAAQNPVGKWWRRPEPVEGDPYNLIEVRGATVDVVDSIVQGEVVRDYVPSLVVAPVEFGTPATITPDDLGREYVLVSDDDRAQIVADQAAASDSSRIDERYPDGSPWAFFAASSSRRMSRRQGDDQARVKVLESRNAALEAELAKLRGEDDER